MYKISKFKNPFGYIFINWWLKRIKKNISKEKKKEYDLGDF